jgi:hypothetical protein
MQILIKTTVGKVLNIDCESSNDVDELKSKIFEKYDIPIIEQRLIFKGKPLLDGKILSDYHIENNSTLHMVLRLRGA